MNKKKRTPLDILAKLLKNPPHHLSIDVYNEDDKRVKELGVKKHKSKYTLNQIGDALFMFIESTNKRFDNLTNDINSLKQDVKDINARLDYNGLKKLPKSR